jgi:hypothetical protein
MEKFDLLYGIMATISMVVYQFFLVQFTNQPSTISAKMALSILIGASAVVIVSVST